MTVSLEGEVVVDGVGVVWQLGEPGLLILPDDLRVSLLDVAEGGVELFGLHPVQSLPYSLAGADPLLLLRLPLIVELELPIPLALLPQFEALYPVKDGRLLLLVLAVLGELGCQFALEVLAFEFLLYDGVDLRGGGRYFLLEEGCGLLLVAVDGVMFVPPVDTVHWIIRRIEEECIIYQSSAITDFTLSTTLLGLSECRILPSETTLTPSPPSTNAYPRPSIPVNNPQYSTQVSWALKMVTCWLRQSRLVWQRARHSSKDCLEKRDLINSAISSLLKDWTLTGVQEWASVYVNSTDGAFLMLTPMPIWVTPTGTQEALIQFLIKAPETFLLLRKISLTHLDLTQE